MIPSGIELVRSWPRPLGMMEGVDESFDAVLFIGYHTSSSNAAGVFAHTITAYSPMILMSTRFGRRPSNSP